MRKGNLDSAISSYDRICFSQYYCLPGGRTDYSLQGQDVFDQMAWVVVIFKSIHLMMVVQFTISTIDPKFMGMIMQYEFFTHVRVYFGKPLHSPEIFILFDQHHQSHQDFLLSPQNLVQQP